MSKFEMMPGMLSISVDAPKIDSSVMLKHPAWNATSKEIGSYRNKILKHQPSTSSGGFNVRYCPDDFVVSIFAFSLQMK